MSPTAQAVFTVQNATIVRPGSDFQLPAINWTMQEGETWAITGSVASGKTTLAEAICGKHRLVTGSIQWSFVDRLRASGRSIGWPSEVIHLVSFKEQSAPFSYAKHYYQQRFNFIEPEDDLTLDQFLQADGSFRDEAIQQVAELFRIQPLRSLSLIKLSNGQMRRARLAKAFLKQPELLILDEPFMGLDTQSRTELIELLEERIQHGTRLILITRPEWLPPWITHVKELSVTPSKEQIVQPTGMVPSQAAISKSSQLRKPILELTNIHVAYDDKAILQGLSWTVSVGDRWALLGPNGSGKSTLLSLIVGDHPQAYSNSVRLWGQQRGSGESIWDIRKRIGFVSPELHLYFSEPLTVSEVLATGFYDVLVRRAMTSEQQSICDSFLDSFGLSEWAGTPFARLSTGQQRLILLLRAMIKQPELLILDEPFQGFDLALIQRTKDWFEEQLTPQQTLIFVTHDQKELPKCVDRMLRLEQGRPIELVE